MNLEELGDASGMTEVGSVVGGCDEAVGCLEGAEVAPALGGGEEGARGAKGGVGGEGGWVGFGVGDPGVDLRGEDGGGEGG
jgi:hypothetical protein